MAARHGLSSHADPENAQRHFLSVESHVCEGCPRIGHLQRHRGDRVHVALHQSFSRPPRFTESEAAALAAAAQALGGEGRARAVKALREQGVLPDRELP